MKHRKILLKLCKICVKSIKNTHFPIVCFIDGRPDFCYDKTIPQKG